MTHIENLTLGELSRAAEEAKKREDQEKTNPRIACPFPVILYICPTEGCHSYYAAPDFTPKNTSLQKLQTKRADKGTKESHNRLECPDCRVQGRFVDRVPFLVTEVIPYEKIRT